MFGNEEEDNLCCESNDVDDVRNLCGYVHGESGMLIGDNDFFASEDVP